MLSKLKLRHKKLYDVLCLVLSLTVAIILWFLVSLIPDIGNVIVGPKEVLKAIVTNIKTGYLWKQTSASLFRVVAGFGLGFVCSVPVAFLLGWYEGFRAIVEPWIQFFRTIPPIALIPLVIALLGIGTGAKVAIIFFAVFLTMVVTIYQGVRNVDYTLIKAAKVFDATDFQIFFSVVVPATIPYIFTAVRLGLATALTTLVAAELTGAATGLGMMIQQAGMYFRMDVVLMGIIVIGIIGFLLDKIVLFLEKKLTSWQEVKSNG